MSSSLQSVDAYVVPIEIADHFPAAIALPLNTSTVGMNKKMRVFKHSNNLRFTRLLADLTPVIVDQNMDSTFEAYNAGLFGIYDNSYPIVRRAVVNNRTENNEWLTPAIKACIKKEI